MQFFYIKDLFAFNVHSSCIGSFNIGLTFPSPLRSKRYGLKRKERKNREKREKELVENIYLRGRNIKISYITYVHKYVPHVDFINAKKNVILILDEFSMHGFKFNPLKKNVTKCSTA